MVTTALKQESTLDVKTIPQILAELAAEGHQQVIIQSLHLFPGHEFHKTIQQARHPEINCYIGSPLLTSEEDYVQLASLLKPQLKNKPDTVNLIIGHGTDHPTWTSYPALERILQEKTGKNSYVAVVEKYPDSAGVINKIKAHGYKRVYMIPFFLVAGLHYRRDMTRGSNSWQKRLEAEGIEVSSHEHGLALLPGIENLIHRHIMQARKNHI